MKMMGLMQLQGLNRGLSNNKNKLIYYKNRFNNYNSRCNK